MSKDKKNITKLTDLETEQVSGGGAPVPDLPRERSANLERQDKGTTPKKKKKIDS